MSTQRTLLLVVLLAVWAAASLGLGAAGVLERLPRPALQGILAGVTVVLLALAFAPTRAREVVRSLPLQALIAVHLTRFVGIDFLWLHSQGRLPYDFAVRGGWGDILTAGLATVILAIGPRRPGLRPLVLIWNLLGLADILMVIFFAARAGLADPPSIVELTRVPLCLLPTMVVPLIVASHVIIFVRLRRPAVRG